MLKKIFIWAMNKYRSRCSYSIINIHGMINPSNEIMIIFRDEERRMGLGRDSEEFSKVS